MCVGKNRTYSFDEAVKGVLKRVLAYWTQITVSLIFFATFVGVASLYAYTNAIGRTDLFMAALDSRAPLAVWVFIVMGGMFLLMVVLAGSAWFYGMAVSQFTSARWRVGRAAVWLLIPLPLGYATLVWLSFYKHKDVGAPLALLYVTIATLLMYAALYLFKPFRRLVIQASANRGRAIRSGLVFFVGVLLLMAVWLGVVPMLMILQTYVGEDSQAAVDKLAVVSLIILSLNLAPQLLFFITRGNVYKRAVVGFGCTLFVFLVFLAMAQGPMSFITNFAAKKLEVRQANLGGYVLDGTVSLVDLDSLQWQTHLRSDGRVQVSAFQLFALGDLLLLCPASLVHAKLYELAPFTQLCIATRSSQAKRLPPKLPYGRPNKQSLDQRVWQRMADCMMPAIKLTEPCNEAE